MKDVKRIIEDVAEIYPESGEQAKEYLCRARRLVELFGPGPATVYCWFYSVPQKWIQVEPKIFALMRYTNSFDLDTVLSISNEKLATIIRPMIFRNQISRQLRNFCIVIKSEYASWSRFAEVLRRESIFTLFERVRNYRNIRVTFKNLAAMKTFVGMDNDLIVLDTHVARVMGISKDKAHKFRTLAPFFKNLLETANRVTIRLREKGFSDVSIITWSLAIWFNQAKIRADRLLTNNIIY